MTEGTLQLSSLFIVKELQQETGLAAAPLNVSRDQLARSDSEIQKISV